MVHKSKALQAMSVERGNQRAGRVPWLPFEMPPLALSNWRREIEVEQQNPGPLGPRPRPGALISRGSYPNSRHQPPTNPEPRLSQRGAI